MISVRDFVANFPDFEDDNVDQLDVRKWTVVTSNIL